MSTKRELVEAHGYNRRRLVTAFVSGAPGGREVEPTRHGRTVIGGVVLALLVVAGAAVSGFLVKPPPKDWDQSGLVIGADTGSRFLASNGTLFPVINITSARLLLADGVDPVTIGDDLIRQATPGATIGIAGAPEVLPTPGSLIDQGWTACTNEAGGVRLTIPQDSVADDNTDEGLLVVDDRDQRALLAQGRRYPVPAGNAGNQVLRSLGLDGVQPRSVTGVWLDLFPEGTPLNEPAVPGGERTVDTGIPGLTESGTPVVVDSGRTYVLTGKGTLAQTSEFAHEIWRAQREPLEIDAQDLSDLRTDPSLRPYAADWPEGAVAPYSEPSTPCVSMDLAEDEAPVLTLSTPRAIDGAESPVPSDGELSQRVGIGAGAVVRAVSGNVLDSGAIYLVDGSGTAFAIGDDGDGDELPLLGFGEYSPRPVPQAWMALLDSGPELTQAAAASRPQAAARAGSS